MHLVGWCASLMRDMMDVFGFESFFCARVYLFLCEYLGTPLCDKVCSLVILVSVVLYFYNVVWGVYCVARGYVGVLCVRGSMFLGRSSFQTNVRGDRLLGCVFSEREGFLVNVLEP